MADHHLPAELLCLIFGELDFPDLVTVTCVYRAWYEIVHDHAFLQRWWQTHDPPSYALYHTYGYQNRTELPKLAPSTMLPSSPWMQVLRAEHVARCRVRTIAQSLLREEKHRYYHIPLTSAMFQAYRDATVNQLAIWVAWNPLAVAEAYRAFPAPIPAAIKFPPMHVANGDGMHYSFSLDTWALLWGYLPVTQAVHAACGTALSHHDGFSYAPIGWFLLGCIMGTFVTSLQHKIAMLQWLATKSPFDLYHDMGAVWQHGKSKAKRFAETAGISELYGRHAAHRPIQIAYLEPDIELELFQILCDADNRDTMRYLDVTVAPSDYRNWPKLAYVVCHLKHPVSYQHKHDILHDMIFDISDPGEMGDDIACTMEQHVLLAQTLLSDLRPEDVAAMVTKLNSPPCWEDTIGYAVSEAFLRVAESDPTVCALLMEPRVAGKRLRNGHAGIKVPLIFRFISDLMCWELPPSHHLFAFPRLREFVYSIHPGSGQSYLEMISQSVDRLRASWRNELATQPQEVAKAEAALDANWQRLRQVLKEPDSM